MDAEQRTKNHVSYTFSKEVILKELLAQDVISEGDFERFDRLLYDRYHLDGGFGIPRPSAAGDTEMKARNSIYL